MTKDFYDFETLVEGSTRPSMPVAVNLKSISSSFTWPLPMPMTTARLGHRTKGAYGDVNVENTITGPKDSKNTVLTVASTAVHSVGNANEQNESFGGRFHGVPPARVKTRGEVSALGSGFPLMKQTGEMFNLLDPDHPLNAVPEEKLSHGGVSTVDLTNNTYTSNGTTADVAGYSRGGFGDVAGLNAVVHKGMKGEAMAASSKENFMTSMSNNQVLR
jgi:hypothetical protein